MSTEQQERPDYEPRGEHNELLDWRVPDWVKSVITDLEGRAFESGIETLNKRGGYEAINYSVYGHAVVEGQQLAILQLRRAYKKKAEHFMSLRKDYYLIGRNENGNAFAHPVDSKCVRGRVLMTADGPVRKALALVWGVKIEELPLIKRNGDVAFIPTTFRSIPLDAVEIESAVLQGSHILERGKRGKLFYSPGTGEYFAKASAKLRHEKGQHPTMTIDGGIFMVVTGARADHWGFTRPTAD